MNWKKIVLFLNKLSSDAAARKAEPGWVRGIPLITLRQDFKLDFAAIIEYAEEMNTLIVGRVYHIVDKTTGKVVKVGSTIRTLEKRFRETDYKKKYTNHFIRESRVINSSEFDWYEKGNVSSPFLWHLVAAEHIEMLKMDTYRKGKFSNKISPLDQKYFGFDGQIGGVIGGQISGRQNAESGHMSRLGKSISIEERKRRASVSGKLNTENGNLAKALKVRWIKRGPTGGKKNAESGHCARIAHLGRLGWGEDGNAKGNHIRWHINGGYTIKGERRWLAPKPNPRCVFCSEESLIIAYA